MDHVSCSTPLDDLLFLVAITENYNADEVEDWKLAILGASPTSVSNVGDLCCLIATDIWDSVTIPEVAKLRIEDLTLSTAYAEVDGIMEEDANDDIDLNDLDNVLESLESAASFNSPAIQSLPVDSRSSMEEQIALSALLQETSKKDEAGGMEDLTDIEREAIESLTSDTPVSSGPTRAPGGVLRSSARRRTTIVDVSPAVLQLMEQKEDELMLEEDSGFSKELLQEMKDLGFNPKIKTSSETGETSLEVEGPCDISGDELEWVLRVLDSCQKKHAIAVGRVYTYNDQDGDTEWIYTKLMGGVSLVTESDLQHRCTHFIRVVHLNGFNPNKSVVFEQPLYPGMKYYKDSPLFHSFEADECMVGISFSNELAAELFYDRMMFCLSTSPYDVIEELMTSKEKSVMLVGENYTRRVQDGMTIDVLQKYAVGGGITDGIEVQWKRPEPPKEVMALMGNKTVEEEEEEATNKKKKEEKVIDLLTAGDTIQKLDRRATINMGGSPTLFDPGNAEISDGIAVSWVKNSKALTEGKVVKSEEEKRAELEQKKERLKRLEVMLKGAMKNGDESMTTQLKQQIGVISSQIEEMQESMGIATKKRRKTMMFSKRLFKKE